VAIRIVQVELLETVGPLLQGRGNTHAVQLDNFQSFRDIVYGERDVVPA
jgi:hypothetical protein